MPLNSEFRIWFFRFLAFGVELRVGLLDAVDQGIGWYRDWKLLEIERGARVTAHSHFAVIVQIVVRLDHIGLRIQHIELVPDDTVASVAIDLRVGVDSKVAIHDQYDFTPTADPDTIQNRFVASLVCRGSGRHAWAVVRPAVKSRHRIGIGRAPLQWRCISRIAPTGPPPG